jgi:hypothetical protein
MTAPDPALDRARARAHELREFYTHLATYVLVCSLLVVIDVANSSAGGTTFLGLSWAYWPILGWGIAIVIHTISVFFTSDDWEERKAKQLFDKQQHPLGHG